MAIRFTDTIPKPVDKKSIASSGPERTSAPASEKKAIAEKALVSDQKADEFFGKPKKKKADTKDMISIRLDPELLQWYRDCGPGYQALMQAVLQYFRETEDPELEDKAVSPSSGRYPDSDRSGW